MADISQPDILKRHHLPDEKAIIAAGVEDGIKKKWERMILEGDFEGGRWGGGENILDLWEKSGEETDPEFQLLMKSFLLESYGVRSLKELEIFAKAEEGNFSSFKSKCQRIRELFGGKEGRVINFWVG